MLYKPSPRVLILTSLLIVLAGIAAQGNWDTDRFPLQAMVNLPSASAPFVSTSIVIRQVYGGGGYSGATKTNDYIGLFNRGTSPVNVGGWSVQYTSATGIAWDVISIPGGTVIPAGSYFLIQGGSNGVFGAPLPLPDLTTGVNFDSASGKVALTNDSNALSGACPGGTSIVDFLGYGPANCSEGPLPAPSPNLVVEVGRSNGGCTDTDTNSSDFSTQVASPQNSATGSTTCPNPTATSTATFTPMDTPTATFTATPANTASATNTATATATFTPTATATETSTPTNTATATATATPVQCTTPPSGMIAWYRAENDATDSFGAHDGTMQNGAGFAAGEVGTAFNLSSGGQYVQIPHSADLDGFSAATIDAWIRPTVVSGRRGIVSKVPGGSYYLLLVDGKLSFENQLTNSGNLVGLTTLSASTWYHVAVTYDGTTTRLFVNGVLDGSLATNWPLGNSLGVKIGSRTGSPAFDDLFLGQIDEVEIFNRELSGSELAAIYNAGTAGKCLINHSLSINAVNGSVSKSPNHVNGLYLEGSTVRLTATPAPGYYFVDWTGDVTSNANPVNVTMNSDKTVTANFALIPTPTNTATNTATDTPTATATSTATFTPTPEAVVSGTVTYGNPVTGANPRGVPGVLISAAGSPPLSDTTTAAGTYSLAGFGTGLYTITPSKSGGQNGAITAFDAGRIAQYLTGNSSFTAAQATVADVSGTSGVSSYDAALIARYAASLGSPTGSSGSWIFNPASSMHVSITTDITDNFSAFLMGDVSGNWGDPSPFRFGYGTERSTTVELPQMTVPTDKETIIPVSVQGAAGKDIIAYEFDLRYDPTVIHPQAKAVELAKTGSRGLVAVVNAEQLGLLRVVVYGAYPIGEDGVLLNLRFTAVGAAGSVSRINFERIMFNEGEPRVTVADGSVEIR